MQYQITTPNSSFISSVYVTDDKPLTMSSLQIAEYAGKRHDHVIRDIRNMLDVLGALPTIGESSYINNNNREMPMYELDEEHTMILCSGYDIHLRAKIIHEWMQMKNENSENTIFSSMNSKQMSLTLEKTKKAEFYEAETTRAIAYIEQQKPKVEVYEQLVDSTGLCGISDAAKNLSVKPHKLFEALRNNKVLQSRGTHKNVAMQSFVERGYFIIKSNVFNGHTKQVTKVTPKGLTWLNKKVKEWELVTIH